jgi:hypothetical protein
MKKIGVEAALNAEMCHLRATINISPHRGANARNSSPRSERRSSACTPRW